jgi:hypothetical protein
MEKIQINLFDATIPMKDSWANIWWPCPEVEYIRPPHHVWDGISIFTDLFVLREDILRNVRSKWKIAWIIEPPQIDSRCYQNIQSVEDYYDYIFTYDVNLLNRSTKYKKMNFGACWITEENSKIYEKTKMVSIVASNKRFALGHQFRHEVIEKLQKKHNFDLWGSGYNPFEHTAIERLKPFKDYRYNIVIENGIVENYFTDKIIDCFAVGSIPIYFGDPSVTKIFDSRGFYTFNTIEELDDILTNKISEQDYLSKMEFIIENHKRFREFASPDRWMYNNCYKPLIENQKL